MPKDGPTPDPRPDVEVIDPDMIVWDDWSDIPESGHDVPLDEGDEVAAVIDATEVREIPVLDSATLPSPVPLSPTAAFAFTHRERARSSLQRFYGPSRAFGPLSQESLSSAGPIARWRRRR